ncbi:unnamed protein product, partial [Rotaria sordida]
LDLHAQQILSSQSKTHYENLVDDDTVLAAAAIWKHFLSFSTNSTCERLVTFVTYIRKNMPVFRTIT